MRNGPGGLGRTPGGSGRPRGRARGPKGVPRRVLRLWDRAQSSSDDLRDKRRGPGTSSGVSGGCPGWILSGFGVDSGAKNRARNACAEIRFTGRVLSLISKVLL